MSLKDYSATSEPVTYICQYCKKKYGDYGQCMNHEHEAHERWMK